MPTDLPILIIDAIGIACFLVAFYFSRRNDEITKFASSVWWMFSMLCAVSVFWIVFLIIGSITLSFIIFSFLVGFITCFVFLSVKENIKLF